MKVVARLSDVLLPPPVGTARPLTSWFQSLYPETATDRDTVGISMIGEGPSREASRGAQAEIPGADEMDRGLKGEPLLVRSGSGLNAEAKITEVTQRTSMALCNRSFSP
jgi:hypothetical protein